MATNNRGKTVSPKKSALALDSGKAKRQAFPIGETRNKDEVKDTLAWKVLDDVQTKEILEVETVQEVEAQVVSKLAVKDHGVDLKEAAILDYYVAALWWAKQQEFNNEQVSSFFTVAHILLNNIKERQLCLVENVKELKRLLAGVGVEGGEDRAACFTTDQAALLLHYFGNTFFKHYKLYEFLYSTMQAEEIIGIDLHVEVAPRADLPWPPPLDEGLSLRVHEQFVATPPPTPAPEASAAGACGEVAEAEADGGRGEADVQREADLLAQLTPETVRAIITEVCDEMLGGLQTQVAQTLRNKESAFIDRINRLSNVSVK